MSRLLGVTLTAVTVLSVTACGTQRGPAEIADDPSPSGAPAAQGEPFEDVDWAGWTGTYTEVREADAANLEELVVRTDALRATAWTATMEPGSVDVAVSPTHVRIRLSGVDVHLDPQHASDPDATIVVCRAEECTASTVSDGLRELVGEDAPDLSGTWSLVNAQLRFDELADQLAEQEAGLLATVDSPIGPVDCFVQVPTGTVPADLEGEPMAIEPTSGQPMPAACVDERGLVLAPPASDYVPLYAAWRPGVDADLTDELPDAATTTSPQPSEQPTPTASATAQPQPTHTPAAGGKPSPFEDATWSAWQPAYRDARMATKADLAALTGRIAALNTTEWTAGLPDGVELVVGSAHVRLSVGDDAAMHVDPARLSSYTLCVVGDGCSDERLGGDPEDLGPLGGLALMLVDAVHAQRSPSLHLDDETAYAVLDSPVGELDCLVGLRGRDVRNLEGAQPEISDEEPVPGTMSEDRVCVDQRGIVLNRDPRAPLLEIASFATGAEDGFDEVR
jgi:hypothetical protein